jgi:hypothetical protein
MIQTNKKLKTYAYDIWVMKGTASVFPAGTKFVDFDHFPTSDDILNYIYDNFSSFCTNGRKVEVAKFYNIEMHCIKFYAGSDTTATYYLINNIRQVSNNLM